MTRVSLILTVTFLLVITTNAYSCLITREWQDAPTEHSVLHSDSIFLARFVRLEPINSQQVEVVLANVETIKGEESLTRVVVTDIVSAVHRSDRRLDSLHSNTSFWEGEQSNARLMGDCDYAPVEYYEDGLYLVMLKDGRFHTSSSFERIIDQEKDEWLLFVRRQVAQMSQERESVGGEEKAGDRRTTGENRDIYGRLDSRTGTSENRDIHREPGHPQITNFPARCGCLCRRYRETGFAVFRRALRKPER